MRCVGTGSRLLVLVVVKNYFGHFGFHCISSDTETAPFVISEALAGILNEIVKLRNKCEMKWKKSDLAVLPISRFCCAAVAIFR